MLVLDLFKRPDILLTTTLVGTNISVVTLTTLGTLLMIRLFGDGGELYATLVFTPLLLVFGEIVPKSIYQQKADQLAPIVVFPLRVFRTLLYPIILAFSFVARFVSRLAGVRISGNKLFITRQQIRRVVEMADKVGHADVFDQVRIKRAIRFSGISVGEAMTPVAEMVAIDRRMDSSRAFALVRRHGYNRLPVYDGNIGNVIGIVTLTVWDLMEDSLRERSLEELMRKPLYVSPLQKVHELLPVLRERQDHVAIVVDEFGSAIGMITMEDIMEEVIGEIRGGYDFDEYRPSRRRHYTRLGKDLYEIDSRVSIAEVNELLDIDLPASESHTIGGFVEARLRHIPEAGEGIDANGWRFIVEHATERAIIKLRVERI
jgi:CBS domain containing-hemolysin-like protein